MALTKISTAMISQSAAAVDLNVDAGTFYVDTTNNRVGVGGKTDPDTPLHVIGTVTATTFAGSGASLTSIPNSALTNSSITINSTAVSLGGSLTLTTANIAENTNLYYTNARADARIAAADTDDLSEGSSNLYYTDARVDARVSGGSLGNITTTGYIRGPSSFTIDPAAHGDNSGTVVIAGNLQVDGTTTTINSTTMTVDDKNITLASGSANAAAASGAGFTVDIGSGTLPSITYDGTNDEWDFNKKLNVTGGAVFSGDVNVFGANRKIMVGESGAGGTFGFVGWDDASNVLYLGNSYNSAFNKNIVINGSGNVGIGTESPASATGYTVLTLNNATNGGNLTFQNNGTAKGYIYNSSSQFRIEAGASTPLIFANPNGEAMRIDASGNVTIGSSTLTADAALKFQADTGTFTLNHVRSVHALVLSDSDGTGEILRIDTNGNLGIGAGSPLALTGNAAPGLTISSNGPFILLKDANNADKVRYISNNTGELQFGIVNDDGSTSKSEHMRIDSEGNVGIGTTSPADRLHVALDSSTTNDTVDVARIEATSSGTPAVGFGPTINFRGERAGASSDSMGRVGFVADVMTSSRIDGAFIVETAIDGAHTERMRISSAGNVGIGTDNPGEKLVIKGTTSFMATNSTNRWMAYTYTDNTFRLNYNGSGADEVTITSAGNVGIGTDDPSAAVPLTAYYSSTSRFHIGGAQAGISNNVYYNGSAYTNSNTGAGGALLQLATDGSFAFRRATSGSSPTLTYSMYIDSAGKVGIGTTSATTTFDIKNAGDSTYTGGLLIRTGTSTSEASSLYHDNNSATTTVLANRYDNAGAAIKLILRASSSSPVTALTALGSGSVGIGTTDPSADYGSDTVLEIKGSTSPGLVINDTGQGSKYGIHADSNDLKINYGTGTLATFQNDGKVGIGTPSPYSLLHINRTATDSYTPNTFNDVPVLTLMHTNSSGQYAGIRFSNEVGNYEHFLGSVQTGSNTADMVFQGYNRPSNVYQEHMRITEEGKVGIGTNDPANTLQIGSMGSTNYGGNNLAIGDGTRVFATYINSTSDAVEFYTNKKYAFLSSGSGGSGTGHVGIGTTSPATPLHVRNVGNPNSGGNRNTVETVLTLDSIGHYPYDGYGVGIDFKGEDYGNTAIREYAKIQAVMTGHSSQNSSGDPSFKSDLTFWTNTGGASSTVATEKMRIDSTGSVGIMNTQTQKVDKARVFVGGVLANEGRHGNGKIGESGFVSVSTSWSFHSSGSNSGAFYTIRFTVPNTAGSVGYGYGSFNAIMQVSGYSGHHCTANFGGYQNQGVYSTRANIIDSASSWTATIGANGSHGFYVQLTCGSSLTHPNAQILVSNGGSTDTASIQNLNDCTWTWS